MLKKMIYRLLIAVITIGISANTGLSQSEDNLSKMKFTLPQDRLSSIKVLSYDFEGYSNYWDKFAWNWYCDSGIFLDSRPDIKNSLWKMQVEIGNEFLLEELWIQKGFICRLSKNRPSILRSPSKETLEAELEKTDVLVLVTAREPVMETIDAKLPEEYQFRRNRAFYLQHGQQTLFVIAGHTKQEMERLYKCINQAKDTVERYSLHKGLAGAHTNHLVITGDFTHNPYDLINKAMQIGCSWIMVGGFDEWLIPEPVNKSLDHLGFPFIFLSGQYGTGGVMYGMKQYPDVQDNTLEQCLDWTEKNNGFFFRDLSGAGDKHASRYSGYVVTGPSNQAKIDSLNAPFITNAKAINTAIPPTMVLFFEKDEDLTPQNIMRAIMDRRAVAVFAQGAMLGPKELRESLRILLLEREYLENVFVEHMSVNMQVKDKELNVTVQNRTNKTLNGSLLFKTPPGITIGGNLKKIPIMLSAYETRIQHFPISCTAEASGKDNPIAVILSTLDGTARALTHVDIPRPVEIHPLILDVPGNINYPVTIWNYTEQNKVEVKLEILSAKGQKPVLTDKISLTVPTWRKAVSRFKLPLKAGEYLARVSALGVTTDGQISIKSQTGLANVHKEDMNNDGIPEIVMENSKIRATILLFGGRVIEYIVKSRDENMLFKLWPEKPPLADTPEGYRAFYPYGGLEEFISYLSIGCHIIYKYEIQNSSGNYVRVRVWANIHGSKIEKIITLFADSEVLEVRYAINDLAPNIHTIGINPLIEIGPTTGPEDVYYFPAEELEERSPVLDRYYGDMFFLKEGWAAGYDTKMDMSLIIGYPVNDAMFLHLWNNHPNNTPTPYYYTELQPWLKIKHGTTTYFSYYLFGRDGHWKPALEEFKQLGLVTRKK